jgi:hypothetical protein
VPTTPILATKSRGRGRARGSRQGRGGKKAMTIHEDNINEAYMPPRKRPAQK